MLYCKRNMQVLLGFTIVSAVMLLPACGQKKPVPQLSHRLEEAWQNYDAPTLLVNSFESVFDALPLAGDTEHEPWPDSYWPSNKGGLAWRWQSASASGQGDHLYSKEELLKLTQAQLSRLSPAEKYDIFRALYDYPLTHAERRRTSPTEASWHGLCHGWAAAAYQFSEPDAVTLTNPDGLEVPFAASDIKALLAFMQQYQRPPNATKFLGLRCNRDDAGRLSSDPACKGVNAGAFHLIMSNLIGKAGQAFVLDISRDKEVWNMPAYGFASHVLAQNDQVYADAAPGTKKVVEVKTELNYIYIINPRERSVADQSLGQRKQLNYRYSLELDEAGKVIGGKWKSASRPDFVWLQSPADFTGDFAALKAIYDKATE